MRVIKKAVKTEKRCEFCEEGIDIGDEEYPNMCADCIDYTKENEKTGMCSVQILQPGCTAWREVHGKEKEFYLSQN